MFVLLQAEKFGNSFALEALISEKVKSKITQAVSRNIVITDTHNYLGQLSYSILVLCFKPDCINELL